MDDSINQRIGLNENESAGNGAQSPSRRGPMRVRRRRRGRKQKANFPEGSTEPRVGESAERDFHANLAHLDNLSSDQSSLTSNTSEVGLPASTSARKIFGSVRLRDRTNAHIGDTYIQPKLANIYLGRHRSEVQGVTKWMDGIGSTQQQPTRKRICRTADAVTIRELSPICGQGGLSVETRSAPLYVYYATEVLMNDIMRIDTYSLLYNPAKGDLFRLFITICMPTSSALWRSGGMGSGMSVKGHFVGPSRRALRGMLDYLHRQDATEQDQHFYIEPDSALSFQTITHDKYNIPECGSQQSYSYLQQMTGIARHWNIPWYTDDSLDHCQLFPGTDFVVSTDQFLAWLGNRWVLEWRFTTDRRHIDAQAYNMNFFHTMNGRKGFATFYGVIRDYQNTVNAFLLELPANALLLRLMAENIEPPSLQRREKWCRQLVEIVKEAHSLSMVIGYLGEGADNGVAIDENDDVMLYKVGLTFAQNTGELFGPVPPEYWAKRREDYIATMESDLYQLGFLLWRIYGDQGFRARKIFCKAADCDTFDGTVCKLPHTNPVGLPMPAEIYPAYLRDVIIACRAEDPTQRVAAHKLLELYFPHVSNAFKRRREHENWNTDAEQILRRYGSVCYCDLCGQECSNHHFHCWVCHDSNFDICLECFFRGRSCLNPSHDLQEFRGRDEERFHSAPDADGKRQIMNL